MSIEVFASLFKNFSYRDIGFSVSAVVVRSEFSEVVSIEEEITISGTEDDSLVSIEFTGEAKQKISLNSPYYKNKESKD